MISKIEITSELEVLTGMHIGGTNEFAAIGAIDSPVVRDVISRLPMIPGSTLKGKMRTLMSRQYSENYMPVEVKNDPEIVQRLFGSADKKEYRNARLQFSDSLLSNIDEVKSRGVSRPTEVKFENTIKRLTSEELFRGANSIFRLSIILTVMHSLMKCRLRKISRQLKTV